MHRTLRVAHLVVGGIAVGAFVVTGMIMHFHQPPLADMDWGDRLHFRSRHIYVLAAALVNLALGIHFALPAGALRRSAAILGSLLALAGAPLLFFAFFSGPMAGREPGGLSTLGLIVLFAGVTVSALAGLRRGHGGAAP